MFLWLATHRISREPTVKMLLNKFVVVQVRVGTPHAINFRALAG